MSFLGKFAPWTCASCGQKNISANKTTCPKCYTPRGENPSAPAGERPKQIVRVYNRGDIAKEFQKDAARLGAQGYHVHSQTVGGESSRVGAAILFGPLALAAGRKPKEMTVIYVRD